jgi:GPH family glycoside/pentoside/hexuronide:cation symporter
LTESTVGTIELSSPVQKTIYSTGDFIDGVHGVALGQFLLFFLTAVVGLSGSAAGSILALTLIVDAFADPLVGYVSDNARFKSGRRHPFMLASIIPLGVSMGLLFSVPHFQSPGLLFGYVLVVLLMVRFSYSLFMLPYIALGAELVRDYTERSVLQVYRNFLNICAVLITVVLGFGVFMSGANGLLTRGNYAPFGWACGAILVAASALSTFGTFGQRHRMYEIAAPERSAAARILGELRDVFRNRSFVILLLVIVIFWIAQGTAISLGVHAYTYFWKISAATIQVVLISGTIGLFCGVPICAMLVRRFEKKDVCTWAIVFVCALLFIQPVLRIVGVLPTSTWGTEVTLCAFAFVTSVLLTNIFISFNSMMVDATDEHDLLFGVRREGTYFAALSFSGKAALGVGSFVAGVALDLIHFPSDLAAHPHQVIAPLTIMKLGLICGPGAAAISAFSAFAMTRYGISRKELLRIQEELRKRDGARA